MSNILYLLGKRGLGGVRNRFASLDGGTSSAPDFPIAARGDTAANWTSANPTPPARVLCVETDTRKVKVGDGATAWTSLGYLSAAPTGALLVVNNLNDVNDAGASRLNVGVGLLAAARAVATANVASLSGTTTIDGVSLAAGDRVLLAAQTTASQNGPWIVAAGAWSRPTDFPAAGSVRGRTILVVAGTVNAGTVWALATDAAVTVDTTSTTWALANSGSYVAKSTLAALTPTGLLKVTTSTGALSVATQADYPLAVISDHLTSDSASFSTTITDIMTTGTIPVGTYVVTFTMSAHSTGGTGGTCEMRCTTGTATATFDGCYASDSRTVNAGDSIGSLSFKVVVTVAGTLKFQAYSGQALVAKALTAVNSWPGATGYVMVREA